jgi:hypothetical protein
MSLLEAFDEMDLPTVNVNGTFNESMYINCTWNDTLQGFNEPFCNTMSPPGSLWLRLLVLVLYGIVCVVGLCGNTLVIYVVLRFSKMQTGEKTSFGSEARSSVLILS